MCVVNVINMMTRQWYDKRDDEIMMMIMIMMMI